VLGGGPAGCAAARLLAQWGRRVVLVTRPATVRHPLGESIPPSTRKLFDLLGVGPAIESAGFVRSTGNTVWWGSGAPRVEYFANGEHGWQVTDDRLEGILRAAVAAAGVDVIEARLTSDDISARGAAFVLDCTGRGGVWARARGLRVHEPDLRTVALIGLWEFGTLDVPDASHTLVESYESGWAWSVPVGRDQRLVAVMVDPRTSNLAKAEGARAAYLHELARTRCFRQLTAAAELSGGPWGWDASMYSASRYADGNVLLVGDAGSFIDPLSSAGVKKALASAWLAAVAVHTALERPAMRDIAFDFYAAREREIYTAFRRLTERYLADALSAHQHPFWIDRAGALDDDGGADDVPAIQRAFDRLRDAAAIALRASPSVRIEPRPAVSGCHIVLEPRVVTAALPQGMRYIRDVDLVSLIELAPASSQVPDLFEAYCRRAGPVALPDFLAALSTVLARGWLLWP